MSRHIDNEQRAFYLFQAADDPLLEMDFRLPVSVAPHLDISFPTAKSFDSLPKSSTITTTTTSLSSTALPTTTDQLSEKNTAKMRFQFASPIQVSSRVSTSSVTSATVCRPVLRVAIMMWRIPLLYVLFVVHSASVVCVFMSQTICVYIYI